MFLAMPSSQFPPVIRSYASEAFTHSTTHDTLVFWNLVQLVVPCAVTLIYLLPNWWNLYPIMSLWEIVVVSSLTNEYWNSAQNVVCIRWPWHSFCTRVQVYCCFRQSSCSVSAATRNLFDKIISISSRWILSSVLLYYPTYCGYYYFRVVGTFFSSAGDIVCGTSYTRRMLLHLANVCISNWAVCFCVVFYTIHSWIYWFCRKTSE